MPYSLLEKQRESQRNWAKKKREADKILSKKGINKDGTLNLTGGFVTYKQLATAKSVSNLKTWNECLLEARAYLGARKINRIQIASIVLRACVIRHGGDIRGIENHPTVNKFAREIGIHQKTVWEWIRVKRHVVDVLGRQENGIDYSAANLTLRTLKLKGKDPAPISPEKVIETYISFVSNPRSMDRHNLKRYLSAIMHMLEKHGTKQFLPEEKADITETIKQILKILNA